MNDLISRSDFKKMLVKQFAGSGTHEDDAKEMNGWNCCRAKIIDILDRQPTLEIVRCKDCKYGDYCGENMFICEFHGCQMADFYCADGKMYD